MKRRTMLTTAVGLGAAALGAGLSWRRHTQELSLSLLNTALWSQSFERPDGSLFAMESMRGRPVLINFWATWCPPCVEELPLLNQFFRRQSANPWQVLGLAVDQADAVRRLLSRTPLDFPVGIVGFAGLELAHTLGNTTRQLPFSLLLDSAGALMDKKLGAFTQADLSSLTE